VGSGDDQLWIGPVQCDKMPARPRLSLSIVSGKAIFRSIKALEPIRSFDLLPASAFENHKLPFGAVSRFSK
jgi:hypothetical protein